MGDIGIGLLLNLVFWVVSVSALVFLGVWAAVSLIDGLAQRTSRIRDTVRDARRSEVSRHPAQAHEEAGERTRKAA